MNFTPESPLAPLKRVVLEYLRTGCPDNDVEPQFVNDPDAEDTAQWQFVNEDEFVECNAPCFLVTLNGDPEPLTETWPVGWRVPLAIDFFSPASADAEWLQSVETTLNDLLNGIWHADELAANPAERTPLALRLTRVAAAMDPVVPLYVAYCEIAHAKKVGMLGTVANLQVEFTVCAAMFVPH